MIRLERVPYAGWPNCLRISNGLVECVATTDVGPRIIRVGFTGSKNLFAELPECGRTGDPTWLSYGGHRLWHAPEDPNRTYQPDNTPVPFSWNDSTLTLTPPAEPATGIAKSIALSLHPSAPRIRIVHTLHNQGLWPVTLSVWALSVMAPGGFAFLPQEDHAPHSPHTLLPVRSMALWSYTDMTDPRWTWGRDFIILRQDPNSPSPQKAGWLNRKGWLAYHLDGEVFLKRFTPHPDLPHPDFNTNTQLFTNNAVLELETLSPLITLPPGGTAVHEEEWILLRAGLEPSEPSLRTLDLSAVL